jgi:hypothetical protein
VPWKEKRLISELPNFNLERTITKVTMVPQKLQHCAPSLSMIGSMVKRREGRVSVPISVRLWGLDREGKVFSQNVKTLNIATSGARVFGVTAPLEPGFLVGLQCGNMRARFMVVWVGEAGSSREGQIGLRAAENGLWSVALPRAADEDFSAWLVDNYLQSEA